MQKFSIVQSQTPRMPKKINTKPEEARSIKVWTNRSTTLRQNISYSSNPLTCIRHEGLKR